MATNQHDFPTVRRSAMSRAVHRKSTWILGVPIVLVLATAGGMFGYLQYMNGKTTAPLSFSDVPDTLQPDSGTTATVPSAAAKKPGTAVAPAKAGTTSAAPAAGGSASTAPVKTVATSAPVTAKSQPAATSASPVEGRWLVGSGSRAGYRMDYSAPVGGGTRVGRGTDVTGEFTIVGTTLKAATFAVDMRTVKCDGGDACTTHVNEMMDTANRPYERFTLTKSVDLKSIPADGKVIKVSLTGKLTLRGVTRAVTFPLSARRHSGRIEVLGSIPVNRDDYKIPDSGQPGFDIDKDGFIELLLVFDRKK